MKRVIFSFLMTMFFFMSNGQKVNFRFYEGIKGGALKMKMEQQISNLLTEINVANATNRSLDYTNVTINQDAQSSLENMWESFHLKTEELDISSECILFKEYYRARGISVEINDQKGSYEGDDFRELVIDLDKTGRIVKVMFGQPQHMYEKIYSEGERLGDMERRMQIIQWCEYLAKAYCDKNMNFLNAVYSEDALIITGKIQMQYRREKMDGVKLSPEATVVYTEQTKTEYLNNLAKIFKAKKYVNVLFENFEVLRHPAKPNFYGVTLTQKWFTPGYSDVGTLFLIWDFTNEEEPRILVRTWTPEQIESEFSIHDFELP